MYFHLFYRKTNENTFGSQYSLPFIQSLIFFYEITFLYVGEVEIDINFWFMESSYPQSVTLLWVGFWIITWYRRVLSNVCTTIPKSHIKQQISFFYILLHSGHTDLYLFHSDYPHFSVLNLIVTFYNLLQMCVVSGNFSFFFYNLPLKTTPQCPSWWVS